MSRLVLLLMMLPRVAWAEEHSEGKQNGLDVRAGLNIGGARAGGETGFLLGAEVSLPIIHFKSGYFERSNPNDFFYLPGMPIWGGIYADVVRDFAADTTRITFGPEVGYGVVGIDGGLAIQRGGQDRTGWVVRPVLTASVIQLYYRYGKFTDDLPGSSFHELGILLKLGLNVLAW